MTIRIGILTVKGKSYHPTARLAEAAGARGAVIVPIDPYGVQPTYRNDRSVLLGNLAAATVQVVLPRQGAEIKTACLPLIAHYEQMGIRVINGSRSIQIARNKFFMLQAITRADLPVPDTVFAASAEGVHHARQSFSPEPVVLKPIGGRQGSGLFCLTPEAAIPNGINQELESGRGVLVQEFIPVAQRRDYRVLVIGRKIVGAVSLEPPPNDFRVNAHIGGQVAPTALSQEVADLAVHAAAAAKLEIAGVDLIVRRQGGPVIIEVNSAPGFRAFEASTGEDVAGSMIDYVLSVM